MAGPLFSVADQKQRIYEAETLNKSLAAVNQKENYQVFSPITAPVNDKSTLPTAEMIYKLDRDELLASEIVFMDLAGYDAGTMMELGMIVQKEGVKVFAYDSDMRIGTAGEYDGIRVPYGANQFVIGGLIQEGHGVYHTFEEAMAAFLMNI